MMVFYETVFGTIVPVHPSFTGNIQGVSGGICCTSRECSLS
jgi:hypothetical protein